MVTYLQELKSSSIAGQLLQELDASNAVCVAIDGQEVVEVSNRSNVSDVVTFEVQVLQMLVIFQFIAQVSHLGILSVFHCEGRESIRATICLRKLKKFEIRVNSMVVKQSELVSYRGCVKCVTNREPAVPF